MEVVLGTGGRVLKVMTGGGGAAEVVFGGGAVLEVKGLTEEEIGEELGERPAGLVTDVAIEKVCVTATAELLVVTDEKVKEPV